MLLSLIVGIILGALAVLFALQNTAIVTVAFFSWQLTMPLALLIMGTVLCGIVLTLLILLPSVIRDELYVASIKRQKREAENELARVRTAQNPQPAMTVQTS